MRATWGLLAAALAIACAAETAERDPASRRQSARRTPATYRSDSAGPYILEADRNAYVARRSGEDAARPQYTFRVIALFVNRSNGALALRRCMSSDAHPLYRITLLSDPTPGGTERLSAYDVVESCSGGAQGLRVVGRGQRIDTITFVGPMRRDGFTGEPVGALDGTFAITYDVATCARRGSCSPYEPVQSAPFQVVRER